MTASKEIQESAKKNPMEMTKEDIVKILKACYPKNPGEEPEYSIDIESAASGFLMSKAEDPEHFKDAIKVFSALATGKYTPGKGALKKKYTTNPYFPSR